MGQSSVLNSKYYFAIILIVGTGIAVSGFIIDGALAAGPELCAATGNYYDIVAIANVDEFWTNANTEAQALTFTINGDVESGHLATITSSAENDCIVAHASFARGYIGFSDNTGTAGSSGEGDYNWVTGEPSFTGAQTTTPFTKWDNAPFNAGAFEPNNLNFDGGGPIEDFENYGEILGSGLWNDIANNNGFTPNYVVEFEPTPTAPTSDAQEVNTDEDINIVIELTGADAETSSSSLNFFDREPSWRR